jgi:[CysO sulfur-carrier protein]-S-L-cysteine hydrolase
LSTPFRLRLPRPLYRVMLAHARAELPNECCGLLAGRVEGAQAEAVRCFPLVNLLASPIEYDADPASLFRAIRDMRPDGLDILAFYHSHPTSAPRPSKKDLARNYWGDSVIHFIISMVDEEPLMQGWRLREDGFDAADWELTGDD